MQRTFLWRLALAGVLAWSSDIGKSTTVKGYVLDRLVHSPRTEETDQRRLCDGPCAKGWFSFGDFDRQRHDLLAHADTTPSSGQNDRLLPFRRTEGYTSGKVFARGGSTRDRDREDRSSEVVRHTGN